MKSAPAFSFRRRILISSAGFWGSKVERTADKERGGLANVCPGMVDASIKALLDQLDQAGWHQVVIIHGVGIIADGGRIAHHDKNIAHSQGMRRQQIALHPQQVAPAGGKMQHCFYANLAAGSGCIPPRGSSACAPWGYRPH